MLEFFAAGGFVMVPVVVVGLLAVAVGLRRAAGGREHWSTASRTLRSATWAVAIGGTALDLATVARVASQLDAPLPVWSVGAAEAVSPLVLGAALVLLSALVTAVGELHDPARA